MMSKHEMIDYCIEKAYDATYADFLINIYTYDPPNDEFSTIFSKNFHNNNDVRFMHLLNSCGDYMDKVECKDSICTVISNILCHSFPPDIHTRLHKLMGSNEIMYPWCGKNHYLDKRTLNLIHTHIINEIIAAYSKSVISFIFTDSYIREISCRPKYHEEFHIYDNPIYEKYKPIIRKEFRKYLSYVSHDNDNLYKVLVYLLCEAKYDKQRDILAVKTSKWKVNTFRPWLNECLQKVHTSERIINKISEWIEKINESRELWSLKPEGEKYVAGAKELLAIMESLQRKANAIE